jgi:hypothetical protein
MEDLDDLLEGTPSDAPEEAEEVEVPIDEATAMWVVHARQALISTAGRYHGYITYDELAEIVQEKAGVVTTLPTHQWLGAVLGAVADDCAARGEPALTALCVRKDETEGPAYRRGVTRTGAAAPDDLDEHAAEARLECYRYFGAAIPAGGGRAALTPKVSEARRRAARLNPTPAAVCPTCFTQLPFTGRCDACG